MTKYKFNGTFVMSTEGIGNTKPGQTIELTPRQSKIADKSPLFERINEQKPQKPTNKEVK